MRILEQQNVDYLVREFPDVIHSADGVAAYFDLPPHMVYKTLVVRTANQKPMLVMLAGGRELKLKKLAKILGEKKIQMAPKQEAETITGLQTGGIAALALLHKHFPIYIDQTALELDRILVSAGRRGVNLELPVGDLIRITGAKVIPIT